MIQKIYEFIAFILASSKGQTIEQLRKKGAIIGKNVQLLASSIDGNTACLIEIGDNVIITNATIYAHDASTKMPLGYTKIAKTKIGSNVFIGAGCIVLPGIIIGDNVIVGAGSIVRRNIPDNSVVMGNPAQVVCSYDEYIEKNKEQMKKTLVYEKAVCEMSAEERMKMREALGNKVGYEL